MTGFHFIDSEGITWMILAGLPDDLPDAGNGHGLTAGITFRSSTGELRVLPRAAIPRSTSAAITVGPFGTQPRIRPSPSADWETLLRQAIVWPPT